jgi:hypothetical protein
MFVVGDLDESFSVAMMSSVEALSSWDWASVVERVQSGWERNSRKMCAEHI